MSDETSDVEQVLRQHAERQTKALENIQGAMMLLVALAMLASLIGLGFLLYG